MGVDAAAAVGDEIGADAAKGAGEAAAGAAGAAGTDAALAAGTDAALTGGADALSATLPAAIGDTAGAVGSGVGATSASLAPEAATGAGDIAGLTVTGTAPAAGAGVGQLASGLAPIAASGLAASGAGGGGSGAPGATGTSAPEGISSAGTSDVAPALSDVGGQSFDSGSSFLPATGDSSVQALSPDVMQSLGIDPASLGDTSGAFDASQLSNPLAAPIDPSATTDPTSLTGDIGKWLSNPKNAATAGMLGLSLKNSLTQPKLPGASAAANANAAALSKEALPVIQSGGTATPAWATQKASIDATIDDQIKQQTESIMQAAAASGEGNQNSGIVQQQIAKMTQQANLQRQQLYAQAQQQNVQEALSAISGGDSTLTAIGNAQLAQSEQAQQLSAQTAELALMLQSGSQWKYPGQGAPGP